MQNEDLNGQLAKVLDGWNAALNRHDRKWFEERLTEDFSYTTHVPYFNRVIYKEEFIRILMTIKDQKVKWLERTARRTGNAVTSIVILQATEEFTQDLGPGMPTAHEMEKHIVGKTIYYSSGWRVTDGFWRMFDHHTIDSY